MGNPWAYDFSAIGRRSPPLLVIVGGDGAAVANRNRAGFHVGGNSDVIQLLADDVQFDQYNFSQQFLAAQAKPVPANYQCVLNLVTDPDQHPQTLQRLRKLLRGYRGRIINHPDAVLRSTRDQVAKRLSGIPGLVVPQVIRLRNPGPGAATQAAERANLAFPVIVRLAGTQTGQSVVLAASPDEVEAACSEPGDYILTQFVDFRSADGLYRKYRFWSFGRATLFKHAIISDQWSIHNADRQRIMHARPDLIEEEKRLFARPEGVFHPAVHEVFNAVRARLGLDFFGMDFGMAEDGRLILFEANATMTFAMKFAPPFQYLEGVNAAARRAFNQLLSPGQ
jgi:glutathione synthase/RimK-type ligase-like ATP-grasp enzyme